MEVNDDNIKLNFNGLADLSRDVYTFDFKTTVDYCDLNTLNLFKRDSISKSILFISSRKLFISFFTLSLLVKYATTLF